MIETQLRGIENMQNADCAYVAGWNIPGYLPEMQPLVFEDETSAVTFISMEIARMWDQDHRGEEPDFAVDNRWIDLYSSLPYETAPFNIQNGDGSLTFWVEAIPCSDLPTHETESD